jgi:hypothetical protein
MSENLILVKVRRVGKTAEQVLHAPSNVSGYYSMHYDEQSGEIHYYPIKEVRK